MHAPPPTPQLEPINRSPPTASWRSLACFYKGSTLYLFPRLPCLRYYIYTGRWSHEPRLESKVEHKQRGPLIGNYHNTPCLAINLQCLRWYLHYYKVPQMGSACMPLSSSQPRQNLTGDTTLHVLGANSVVQGSSSAYKSPRSATIDSGPL